MDSALVSHQAAPGLILSVSKIVSLMLLKFIAIIAENSRQWLESANQNHLVLASGKVQKIITQFLNLPEMLLATLSNRVFSRK